MYLGMVELESEFVSSILVANASQVPVNADALPTYRVYGPAGLMAGGTGSLSLKDSGAITNVTAAAPAVVTSTGHGLSNGTKVTVSGVSGSGAMGNANTTALVANASSNTFELAGVSTATGSYSSGGTWNVAGLYEFDITPQEANGFEAGENYSVLVTYVVSGTTYADQYTFTVV